MIPELFEGLLRFHGIKCLLLVFCAVGALETRAVEASDFQSARERRIAARTERHRLNDKENNVFLTISSGLTSYNQVVGRFKLEYSRQIHGALFWGSSLASYGHSSQWVSYDCISSSDCYRNTVDQNIYKLDGMIFYRLSVISSRLFFRVGGGVGLGWHSIRSVNDDYVQRNRLLPYLNLEGAWILRVAKGFEMKFSPTILILPSELSVSPAKLGASTDAVPMITDLGVSLTLGWRF